MNIKLFSLGGLFLIVFPLTGAIGFFVIGHWGFGLLACAFVMFLLNNNKKKESELNDFRSDFYTEFAARNNQLITMIYKIGKPDSDGKFSKEQVALWDAYKSQDAELNDWLNFNREKLIDMEIANGQ